MEIKNMQEIADFSDKTLFYEYGFLDEEEVLTEINLSSIKPAIVVKNSIRIDKPSILMVLPDENVSSVDAIYNYNCLLSMCNGVCVTNDIVKIGRRKFNGRIRFVNLKKEFLNVEINYIWSLVENYLMIIMLLVYYLDFRQIQNYKC